MVSDWHRVRPAALSITNTLLYLITSKSTASGRVTQRASSDPGCISYEKTEAPPSRKAPRGRKEEPMHEWQSLSQVRWECKDHVVIIPKYRRNVFYGKLRRRIGIILREL